MAATALVALSLPPLQHRRALVAAAAAPPARATFPAGTGGFRARAILRAAPDDWASEAEYYEPRDDYIHPRYPFSHQYNPVDERSWYRRILDQLDKLTPIKGVKLLASLALGYTLIESFLAVVFNPKVCMYASWSLIFWPWIASLAIGVGTGYLALTKYWRNRKLSDREELLLLLGSLVWLILVPFGHFRGYVEGYPIAMFVVYAVYVLLDRVARLQIFARTDTGPTDVDWFIPTSPASLAGFYGSALLGHWLAAFEAPPLVLLSTRSWQTRLAAVTIVVSLLFRYFGAYFLYRYSKVVGRPNATVVFGPYRFVRHPIYGSNLMLFIGFCLAMRAYGSLALMVAGCLFYYEQLTKQEEKLLVDHFGEAYESYRDKVPQKYIPLAL